MAARSARTLASPRFRIGLIAFFIFAAWGAMAFRLVQVQVVQASDLADQGLEQRLVTMELAPQRGKIYDRNGELLALTVDAHSLYAVPDQVEEPLWVAQQVGALLDVDADVLYERLTSDRDFVYLDRQVEPVLAEEILAMDLTGVYSLPEATRVYPAGEVASHVTGFVDIDGNGQEGLELVYDEELRGTPGHALFERDLNGRPIPQGMNDIVPADPGFDLNTTIDLPLQYQAQEACARAVKRTKAESCWVVALDIETGGVLAMTGVPVFDPATRRTIDPTCDQDDDVACSSFTNFAVRGIYEPGSTEKLITFAAALEESEVGVGTLIRDVSDELEILEGACEKGQGDLWGCYRDFSEHETTDMTVAEIFTQSSNVGSILIAERLGEARLVSYIEKFGLGSLTGIDYTAEAPGILRFEAGCGTCWASAAIGYSVAVTPLQMAAAYATIGNDGVWNQPHIVESSVDGDGNVDATVVDSHRVVSDTTALLMRELLASVVEDGTGTAAQVDGYRIGGKTGTANKLDENGEYTDETRASFVGLAPIDDPKVVVAVVIDAPAKRYRTGGRSAAPVFAEVMEQALHRLGVAPDAS